jgi:PQQ-dependent catabolism-associated CXXCW motif protein
VRNHIVACPFAVSTLIVWPARFHCHSPSGGAYNYWCAGAMKALRILMVLASGLFFFAADDLRGEDRVPEPAEYRTSDYRAPTPAGLAGAKVISTAEAERLWRDKTAIFVDVLPQAPRPANLPPGTIWRDKPRLNIPGSIWLPDTGYGALAPVTEDYLRKNLEGATGGDRTKLLVIYCLRNCWMSWNATKRILSMGYANVTWYPDGTDGWTDELLPVAQAQPEPGAGH